MSQRGRKSAIKGPLFAQTNTQFKDLPDAPGHLDKPEREMWRKVVTQFELDDPIGLALLTAALDAHARARKLREVIDKEGVQHRWKGGHRQHPLLSAERGARQQSISAFKKLKVSLL
jgi:phage terminase small subunit